MHTSDKRGDKKYAKKEPMKAHGRPDDGNAFLTDPQDGPARAPDDLAEIQAEEYLESATSGEEAGERVRDQVVPEELGGPFLQSAADEEFANDVDGANPPDAEVEPLPRAVGGGR